jgi:hypothetical protein
MTGRDVEFTRWCDKCETYHPPEVECRIHSYFTKQEEINDQFLQALKDAIDATNELGVIYNPICDCGRSIREMFVVEQEEK